MNPGRVIGDCGGASHRSANCLIDVERVSVHIVHIGSLIAIPVCFAVQKPIGVVRKGLGRRRCAGCCRTGYLRNLWHTLKHLERIGICDTQGVRHGRGPVVVVVGQRRQFGTGTSLAGQGSSPSKILTEQA